MKKFEYFDLCRDLQHAWKPVDAWREGKTFVETLRCTRCNLRKDRTYNQRGDPLSSRIFLYSHLTWDKM